MYRDPQYAHNNDQARFTCKLSIRLVTLGMGHLVWSTLAARKDVTVCRLHTFCSQPLTMGWFTAKESQALR